MPDPYNSYDSYGMMPTPTPRPPGGQPPKDDKQTLIEKLIMFFMGTDKDEEEEKKKKGVWFAPASRDSKRDAINELVRGGPPPPTPTPGPWGR